MLSQVKRKIASIPVTAIVGPRQCGKTTLASMYTKDRKDVVWLDLERPADLRKLDHPERFFTANGNSLICIDEIQRKPELFPVIRDVCDRNDTPGRFLILGSASRDLIRQSSESLAGRVSCMELTPFLLSEISGKSPITVYHNRGDSPEVCSLVPIRRASNGESISSEISSNGKFRLYPRVFHLKPPNGSSA
jgi:predicted AAA+ superfamily ATPase